MKAIEWIAILGALAWAPHLISLLKHWVTKPKVRILTNNVAEVGFTTFGPILNLRLAFSVENKDIVVSNLLLKIMHEGGDERVFSWQGITQQLGRMKMPDSNVMPFEKEQSVLAIKLNQKEIEERFIRFQEPAFIKDRQLYLDKAARKMSYLKTENKYDAESFLREPEMTELYSFNKHAFSWKPGKYTLTVEISSPISFKIVDVIRKFTLTPLDVERLANNKEMIEQDFRRIILGSGEGEASVLWHWSNPFLEKEE